MDYLIYWAEIVAACVYVPVCRGEDGVVGGGVVGKKS